MQGCPSSHASQMCRQAGQRLRQVASPPANIPAPLLPRLHSQQRERVSYAIKLGWDVVGLAHQAAAKLAEAQDRCGVRVLWCGMCVCCLWHALLPGTRGEYLTDP